MSHPFHRSIELFGMDEGAAIVIIGVLALLLLAAVRFRNPAAAVAWGFTVILLILTGLLSIGAEVFWLAVVGTTLILSGGFVVRWGAD